MSNRDRVRRLTRPGRRIGVSDNARHQLGSALAELSDAVEQTPPHLHDQTALEVQALVTDIEGVTRRRRLGR